MIQEGHPIALFLKKIVLKWKEKKTAYTKESFAITKAIAKFKHYLLGHKFIIKTYQKSLKSLMNQSLQISEQQD